MLHHAAYIASKKRVTHRPMTDAKIRRYIMNKHPHQLYVFTVKSNNDFMGYIHQIASRQQLVDNLTWCKDNLPDIWERAPKPKDLQYYTTKELAEIYYNGEVICFDEISAIQVSALQNYCKKHKGE